ncbi:hypothetical protein CK203_035642 [Vitis vinifera]|uniref:Uncharacterized protein n=1 Tax=Vitis vinifera TaxID=29760 RepID=A0A438ICI3_VITVI|nr:hypothetical protein CK203_035642 [Vitis vinifera]
MVTQPPIEGNLDCQANHSTLSYVLTERLSDTSQSSKIHSTYFRGARHIAEALSIPYEPMRPTDYKEWAHPSQSDMHMVQRRGAILEALFRISEGFYFGPHHLIMTAPLYFEEKLSYHELNQLLFPRLLCQILEHLGYPSEPQLERRRICRETFTLDKWTSMTAYVAQPVAPAGPEHPEIAQPEEPQQAEIPTEIIAPAPAVPSTGLTPEATSSALPTTLGTLPVVPATSAPHPSESSIVISISEFRGLCHTLQTLTATQSVLAQQMAAIRAHQDQLIATQTQHIAILRQYSNIWVFYHHLSMICLAY